MRLAPTRQRTGSPGRASAGRFQLRLGNALVVLQIMLSMVLLCGAALFVRTLQNLTKLDAGFQREDVLTMRVSATFPKTPGPKEGKAAEEEHARLGRVWEDPDRTCGRLSLGKCGERLYLEPAERPRTAVC